MIHRRHAISIGLCTFVALLLTGLAAACSSMTPTPADSTPVQSPASNLLKIYAPPDQLAPDVLAAYEKKYGVKVAVMTYDSEPELLKTLLSGPIDFDLVLASDDMIPQLRAGNLLTPLDKDQLPNLSNLSPEFQNSPADPGLRHCVPYQWGLIGIGYNSAKIGQAVVGWRDIFSRTLTLRLALPNSPRVTLGAALLASGLSPNTTEKANLDQARVLLAAQANRIISYTMSPAQQLLKGSADVAVDRLGALMAARLKDPALQYALPREGSLLWADYLCLMKETPNARPAEQLLNQLLDPQVGLVSVRFTGQSSPNQSVVARLPTAEQIDPLRYPAANSAQRDRLFMLVELGPSAVELYNEIWNSLPINR
jgi:spermidine/putrescine transport system substrate-binding protein